MFYIYLYGLRSWVQFRSNLRLDGVRTVVVWSECVHTHVVASTTTKFSTACRDPWYLLGTAVTLEYLGTTAVVY
jgi:hypothetical protein